MDRYEYSSLSCYLIIKSEIMRLRTDPDKYKCKYKLMRRIYLKKNERERERDTQCI